MNHLPPYVLAAAVALLSSTASAVQANLAAGGFTGLGVTPNARLLDWGQFGFAYDRQIPGAADPSGHNFVAGFGLLPNLEVAGRLAANQLHTNCFLQPCGLRDLSASAKVGIGLGRDQRWRIAAGVTDMGGAATNFRSVYGVLTYSRDTLEFSGGYARRHVNARVNESPLDGVFGSAAWQPFPFVRGHLEYTDGDAWAGVRLFAPASWLPNGWSAHLGVNTRLTSARVTQRSWLSAGVTIPLYNVPALPPQAPVPAQAPGGSVQPDASAEPRAPLPQVAAPAPAAPAAAAPTPAPQTQAVTDSELEELARNLQGRGLEDIWVGRMADQAIAVRADNATYNWNSVDALGAALGGIARTLGERHAPYRLVLTQRQVPIVAVTGRTDCLRQWIDQPGGTCAGGELSTPGTLSPDDLQAGANWLVRGLQASWKTLRVQLSPVLRTNVGTEVGALDYSAGVNVGLSQPLWAGASADWRVQAQVAHSDDYGPGRLLEPRRVLNGTERLAFTQTARLNLWSVFGAPGDPALATGRGVPVTVQGTVGRIGHHFDGVLGAVRWEPGIGRHRVTAQAGAFHNSRFGLVPGEPRNATPLLLSYRYNVAPTRTYLEATGGRFMNNDAGLQLGLRQWFGDVAVQVYARRTRSSSNGSRTQAGLELSVPIGPRRDMQPSTIQVTGTPRFAHAIETVVGSRTNAVVLGRGVLPPAPSLETLYNSDRASLLYFEDNLRRLREAAR